MNLIEKLGGYEKANRELELKEQDSVLQCCSAVTAEMIRDALLEYRRQHNIFEIDDLITNPVYDWKILKVHDPIKSEDLLFAKTNDHVKHHWGHGLVFDDKYVVAVHYSECRHATPEEIAAGKRL